MPPPGERLYRPAQLVADVELVRVEEEQHQVHPAREPLQHLDTEIIRQIDRQR